MGESARAGPEEVTGGGQGEPSHHGAEVLDRPRGGYETARMTAEPQGRRGYAAGPTVLHERRPEAPKGWGGGSGWAQPAQGCALRSRGDSARLCQLDRAPSSLGNKLPPRGAPGMTPAVF